LIDKYAKKLKQRAEIKVVGSKKEVAKEFKREITIGKRKRSRKRRVLSVEEKLDISYKILCENLTQTDVAKEYRVTLPCICNIIRSSRKDPDYLSALIERRDLKIEQRKKISGAVMLMCEKG